MITAKIEQFINDNHTLEARASAALKDKKFHIKVSHVAVKPNLTKARVEATRAKIFDDVDRQLQYQQEPDHLQLLSLIQRKRFDCSPGLKALTLQRQEISSFRYHLTPSGHAGFDAVVGAHDDLICAICIPLIIGK